MTEPVLAQGSLIAGRYRLDRHLGEGGMGTVWSATHVVTRRAVAIKLLRTSIQHKADVRQRFLREAQAASALRHPNVVEVLDVFDLDDGSPVMVMELLEGETLGQKLLRDERLSLEETAALLLPVMAAVGAAHAAGVVHRDLKPENIFLVSGAETTTVKVLDFGIAKLTAEYYISQGESVLVTEAGSLLGTPCYMAPEQIGNTGVDHRADIWSLGVILYECLSGTRPIEGQNMAQVVARLLNEAITPLDRLAPELPHDVTALVQQTLSRDVRRRPQDLGELTRVFTRYSHVRVPSFGAPLHQAEAEERRPSVPARRSAPPPSSLARSSGPQGATMLSAPAVDIDGARSARSTTGTGRARAVVAVVALAAAGSIWFLSADPKPPTAAALSATASLTPPPPPSALPPETSSTPEPPPATTAKPTATTARPAARASAAVPARAAGSATTKRPRPAKRPAQANEDSLFSGRK